MKDIDKNKMKHTIGYKMTVIIVAIMGLSLIAASIFSSFFLSKYYKKTKQDSIKKVYNEFIKISMLESLEIKGFIGGNIKNEIRNRNMFACFIYSFISFKSLINGDKL